MAKAKPKFPSPTFPEADELLAIVSRAIDNFSGGLDELESAIGMLYMGHAFGWRVIYIVHSVATIRKYEKILAIKAKDVFPERTAISKRSNGFVVAETVSNFWKAVKGENTPEGFRDRSIA